MKLYIEELLALNKRRKEINNYDIGDIEFCKEGKIINIPKQILKEWKYVGLSISDFVNCYDWENEKLKG